MLQVAGRPARCTVTDGLRSDKAMSELGNAGKQEIGRLGQHPGGNLASFIPAAKARRCQNSGE
jgi:hypothetical protein